MSLLGGFLGGALTTRFGIYPMLWWGAILASGTNILFMIQAKLGANLPFLYVVISADNLAAGLASAAFVALSQQPHRYLLYRRTICNIFIPNDLNS